MHNKHLIRCDDCGEFMQFYRPVRSEGGREHIYRCDFCDRRAIVWLNSYGGHLRTEYLTEEELRQAVRQIGIIGGIAGLVFEGMQRLFGSSQK